MKVFLKKDIVGVGLAGEIIKVTDGYALNYLVPKGLGIVITSENEAQFKNKIKVIEKRKEVIATKTSILAERIKALDLVIKRKMHDKTKLYGAISSSEIVDLLGEQGIKVTKSQILLDKSIKERGTFPITIKLSSKLQPAFTLKVVPE